MQKAKIAIACAGLLASPSLASADWMLQVQVRSTPDGFTLIDTVVSDCSANDWRTGGAGLVAEMSDPDTGAFYSSYALRDPRIVTVEPPDGGAWLNEELVPSGSVLMLPDAFHALSFPLPLTRFGGPVLPVKLEIRDEAGTALVAVVATSADMVPADVHRCFQLEWEGPPPS
jgi:hypothetical protein